MKILTCAALVWTLGCLPLMAASADGEVKAAFEAWREAELKADVKTFEKYLHDDLIYTHSDGRYESKPEILKRIGGPEKTEFITLTGPSFRAYGNMGLVKSKMDIRTNYGTGRITESKLDVLQVWLKTPQGWKLLSRQATRLAQPVEIKQ